MMQSGKWRLYSWDLHVVTFSSITTTNSLCDSIPVLLLLLVLALVKILRYPPWFQMWQLKTPFGLLWQTPTRMITISFTLRLFWDLACEPQPKLKLKRFRADDRWGENSDSPSDPLDEYKMQSWLLTEQSFSSGSRIFIMMMSSQIWDDGRALLPVQDRL